MKVLVTAGSTMVPIDKVRGITNIFMGKTGTDIAHDFYHAYEARVVLLTSNAALSEIREYEAKSAPDEGGWDCSIPPKAIKFKTFDELRKIMRKEIISGGYDVIIHSAAVSDYQVKETFVKNKFGRLVPIDSSKKIPSSQDELYLKLAPTIKLVDQIREPWGFKGKLVKFKLEVGKSDAELIEIAKKSRIKSKANFIVANCLEWAERYAYIIGTDGEAQKVKRDELSDELYRRLT